MQKNKKIYFLSDIHLGLPNHEKSLVREKLLVKLLDEIKIDAHEIYFVGDIFDFWWEYKRVAPRGYIRFLGKIAEIADSGIPVHFFTGNHDLWMRDYLPTELGVKLHTEELIFSRNGKTIFAAHGDGLGPGDKGYKLLKKVFANRFLQWCLSRFYPNFAFGLAERWSQSSRKKEKSYKYMGEGKENIIQFAKQQLERQHYDFQVFGHRHFPMILGLNEHAKFINIGDWIVNFTFAVFDGNDFELRTFKNGKQEKFTTNLEAEYKINIF